MREDIEYLYSLRKYIFVTVVIFILSLIIGVLESEKNPDLSKNFLEPFEKLVRFIKTINPPVIQTIVLLLIIFLNNALKSLAVIVLGVVFGIFPLYLVAYNGEAVGLVAYIFSKEKGISYVLAALLPHGILEIPMILLSAGIGLRLGHATYLSLRGAKPDINQGFKAIIGFYMKKLKEDIRPELKQGINFYMRWIAPLLLVAALIETFITPLIVFRVMT